MFSKPGGRGGRNKVRMILSAKLLIIYYKTLKIFTPWEGILYVYTSISATATENRINLPLHCYSSLENESYSS